MSELGVPGQVLLDLPAGNGKFSEALRQDGFEVVSGDINKELNSYVHVNMEAERFPFEDKSFDWVVCMEGIEHVLSPASLVSELCRITKDDGHIIISTPNVQSFYSRLKFLFTGVLYMFEPETTRHPRGSLLDRGHISPMTFPSLCYLFAEHGFSVQRVAGDKVKRLAYLPIYLLLGLITVLNIKRRLRKNPDVEAYRFMSQRELLSSRSFIGCWKKTEL